jgi:hypothetical protein
MIRTDHQHFVVTVGRARAIASTLKAAERAKRELLNDWWLACNGAHFKKPASYIVGPILGPASEAV